TTGRGAVRTVVLRNQDQGAPAATSLSTSTTHCSGREYRYPWARFGLLRKPCLAWATSAGTHCSRTQSLPPLLEGASTTRSSARSHCALRETTFRHVSLARRRTMSDCRRALYFGSESSGWLV